MLHSYLTLFSNPLSPLSPTKKTQPITNCQLLPIKPS